MFQIGRTPHLIFGAGARQQIPDVCRSFGKKILLITGKSSFEKSDNGQDILKQFSNADFKLEYARIHNEPSTENIDSIADAYRFAHIDCIVSIGGGSVIDAGKAVSAMIPLGGSVEEYLENVGTKTHPGNKIPFIAVPTTSGTGSEATKNAVISKMGIEGYKKSLRHNNFIPDYAVIDPELMLNCPPEITASTGMDAFTQLVESFLSVKANPFTDAMAIDGIKKIVASLEKAVFEGKNLKSRTDMAFAAYLSGITLANAGLGVVHGFAQPLGCMFPIPHGVVCGTLMSSAHEVTLSVLERLSDDKLFEKYCILGSLVTKSTIPDADLPYVFVKYTQQLAEKIKIPRLSDYGVKPIHIDDIIKDTDIKNHPVQLSQENLAQILLKRI